MTAITPRFTPEEHARLGTQIYEQRIRPQVEAEHKGQIVAIDVESGEFELGADGMSAAKRLQERRPGAQIWCVRIGYPAVHRFGLRPTKVRQ
jgi:hypothetical protein